MVETELKLYNTLTRSKEPFTPIDAKNVRMYVCGPTVYDYAHIGNARPVIVFDVLYRLLRHIYGEQHVRYVRNITDIDDKINKRAFDRWTKKRPLLDEVKALTELTAKQYEDDVAELGCIPLSREDSPRATDFVCNGEQPMDMVRVIEKLVAKGFAYVTSGHNSGNHVLFDVSKMLNYGQLSKRSLDEMRVGSKAEVAPGKNNPMDFVLWKPSDPALEPGWDSPWGFGRPGWHIECSAMSGALLGEQFDIHAGGLDLIFPHHENEIAQTCCAFGVDKMASVWMHNGFLQVEGQKMSKSAGNFFTIQDVLKDWSGEVVRLNMLKTHYRQPIDWTIRGLKESEENLRKWSAQIGVGISKSTGFAGISLADGSGYGDLYGGDGFGSGYGGPTPTFETVIDALLDDLNTPFAATIIHSIQEPIEIVKSLRILGFDIIGYSEKLEISSKAGVDESKVTNLITSRLDARRGKDFATSDRLRDELLAMGIQLKDGKDPVTGEPTTTWEVKR